MTISPDIHIVITISSDAIEQIVKLVAFIALCAVSIKALSILKRGSHDNN
jgi:hypothetical protein